MLHQQQQVQSMMASLGGGSVPPLPLPAEPSGPAVSRLGTVVGRAGTGGSSGTVSTFSTVVSPSKRKGKRKTPPPPARYTDQQTLTQMEHLAPRARDVEFDEDLPPGVTPVLDASGKTIYRLRIGGDVRWFLNKTELYGKRPASENLAGEDNDEEDDGKSSYSHDLFKDGSGEEDSEEDDNDDDDTVVPVAATGSILTTGSHGAATEVTPDHFRPAKCPPPIKPQHMSQLSRLTESQFPTDYSDDEFND